MFIAIWLVIEVKEYGYSVYMNNIFYGHARKVNGLLNLDRGDTHVHKIDAKKM